MVEYYREVAERKRLASQAKYRKNGSKSRRCPMSTDRMTQKQWKERNGKIMSYNLGQPMGWRDFKELPNDLQKDYISNLASAYGVTISALAKMFGVNQNTLGKYVKLLGLSSLFGVGRSMTKQERQEWSAFIGAEQSEDPAPEIVHEEPVEDSQFEAVEVLSGPQPAPQEINIKPATVMTEFTISFSGYLDPATIANSLALILGQDSTGKIDIVCELS